MRRRTPADPGGELLEATDATAVLGRAGHPSGDAARRRWRFIEHLLDHQFVVPAVTEVVLVPELVALLPEELVESYAVFERPVLALLDVEGRDEGRRAAIASGAEPVQVAVGPTHRCLNHVMHPGQGEITGQLQSAPDRRLGAVHVQAHAEPADLCRDREQRRRLVVLELLEDAGHLPVHQGVEERHRLLGAGFGQQLLHQMLDVDRFGHDGQSITVAQRAT